MSASSAVLCGFQKQVFQDLASPKANTYLGRGIFSRCVLWCGFILTSTEVPLCGSAKAGLFPLSALAAMVSAEEPRSGGQTLVCVPLVKERFPLIMKYLGCLETTLFWTLSAASFITFALSACQKETHTE